LQGNECFCPQNSYVKTTTIVLELMLSTEATIMLPGFARRKGFMYGQLARRQGAKDKTQIVFCIRMCRKG
jgi:hypothetical protein